MASRPIGGTAARRSRGGRSPSTNGKPSLTLAERRKAIIERLAQVYANAKTALHYKDTYQLLVAVILSAQCTDARVNMVTPALFERYPDVESMARANIKELEKYIKTCGLFSTKAKNIVGASKMIVERFSGQVPSTMDELLELPGVGRKTANVVLSVAFEQAAIAVDTHVFRVANRLGLVRAKTPHDVEKQLMRVVPKDQWSDAHHWLIHHGREICFARNPNCAGCPLVDLCPSAKRYLRAEARERSGR